MDFKFKTIFSSVIKPVVSAEKDVYLAKASLLEIAKYIPAIDTTKNVDLLPVSFSACVANRVNKNDDVADSASCVAIAKLFINKPVNIEHKRDSVIGVVVSYAFSKFGSDEPLTEAEALATKEPFNVVLGAVLWRVVNKKLTDYIEESGDPASPNYMEVSASWELGFMNYSLAVIDGNSRSLSDATIITDEKEVDVLSKFLRSSEGGTGVLKDGKKVYRKVEGEVLPLGIGLTEAPAAEVQGIASATTLPEKEKDETKITAEVIENTPIASESISQIEKSIVIDERKDNMITKINKLEELTDESMKQIANASVVSDFVKEELKKANDAYVTEKGKAAEDLKTAQAASEELKTKLAELEKQAKTVQASLDDLNKEKAAREKTDRFNVRMASFDKVYTLSDAERGIIAADIPELDETAFAAYAKKLEVLLASKKIVEQTAEEKAASEKKALEAKASLDKQTTVDTAVDNAAKDKQTLPNTDAGAPKGLFEKFKGAFAADQWNCPVKLTD